MIGIKAPISSVDVDITDHFIRVFLIITIILLADYIHKVFIIRIVENIMDYLNTPQL